MAEVLKQSVDSEAFLKAQVGKKIKYNDRKKVEVIKETTRYKVGQILNPHKLWADELIKQKIAKAYSPKKEND